MTNNSAVTDLAYLHTFCAGNKEKMQKYIDMFLKSMPAVVEKINAAITANDYIEIANQVHGCKTKFTMMGMKQAFDLSQTIELQCRDGKINGQLNDDIATLLQLIPEAEKELKATA
jgi:HPt (histidine-containing phosphotransfer) domain-containing protein